MSKRHLEETGFTVPSYKRLKSSHDRLSVLSDELLLRILSFLPIEVLALCQSISHKFNIIAGDSELWKSAYYYDFVQPRLSLLLARKRSRPNTSVNRPAHSRRWLDEEELASRGPWSNWKQQYKVRHRWSRGLCGVEEIPVATKPPVPPLVARMLDSVIYSADSENGLRIWSYKNPKMLLSSLPIARNALKSEQRLPLCLTVDRVANAKDVHEVAIGFYDGSLSMYKIRLGSWAIQEVHDRQNSCEGPITAIASLWPYLLTLAQGRTLCLYRSNDTHMSPTFSSSQRTELSLCNSMRSQAVRGPLSISLREVQASIFASIAFSVPALSGWSIGIQELQFNKEGKLLASRVVTSAAQGRQSLPTSLPHVSSQSEHTIQATITPQPTSISYSHPYLLVSHADNTLTLFMVTSTVQSLKVTHPTRLWGHTSAVFGAHVGPRGRAVSVSSQGGEIRVWQLEGATASEMPYRADVAHSSVQLTPEKKPRVPSRTSEEQYVSTDKDGGLTRLGQREQSAVTRAWVGFDEESVVVLKERSKGQSLAIYDFS